MLDAIVAFVVVMLVLAGILLIIGPNNVLRRVGFVRRARMASFFEPKRPREVGATNPNTQRVVVAAGRLASWMRSNGHDDVARDIRAATARLNGNEATGLYALQTTLRRIRVINITDSGAHERLRALVSDLRKAVEDRFEQLELLPFKRP